MGFRAPVENTEKSCKKTSNRYFTIHSLSYYKNAIAIASFKV